MKKTRIAKSFYKERHLEAPKVEYWPENAQELRELIETPASGSKGDKISRVIIGDGQHVRDHYLSPTGVVEVIRTSKCTAIKALDTRSGLVRVEAGISWRDLQQALSEEGWGLSRYGLYPSTSTLGGLLAMEHPFSKDLFYGDIREGCVALSATSPTIHSYRYIAAPRKASGPDMRYLFIGAEGALGAILDVTMVISKPGDGRLFRWAVPDARSAAQHARALFGLGVRPAWCHYASGPGEFTAAVLGPAALLNSIEAAATDALGATSETGDREVLEARRRWLEDRHCVRRGVLDAPTTLTMAMSLAMVADSTNDAWELLVPKQVKGVEIHHFSAHRALVSLVFESAAAARVHAKNVGARVLAMAPIFGADPVVWHPDLQLLKRDLDASCHLNAASEL